MGPDEPDDPFGERAQERAALARSCMQQGVEDPRVLAALARVPRHLFVPPGQRPYAYEDRALPIGAGQTISQPFVVAFVTQALGLTGRERVLEVGAGCGYQAAVLAGCARSVLALERIETLARRAAATLDGLGYANARVLAADGWGGWPPEAPFDAIVVSAAADALPRALLDQLAPGGRLVAPVGHGEQHLMRFERTPDGVRRQPLLPVRFVPLLRGLEEL